VPPETLPPDFAGHSDAIAESWVCQERITPQMSLSDKQARQRLLELREWATRKIQGGSEPPWAWYQYMKLNETIDAIAGSMDSVTTDSSLQLESRQGKVIQLAASKCRQGTSRRRPADPPVRLPM